MNNHDFHQFSMENVTFQTNIPSLSKGNNKSFSLCLTIKFFYLDRFTFSPFRSIFLTLPYGYFVKEIHGINFLTVINF